MYMSSLISCAQASARASRISVLPTSYTSHLGQGFAFIVLAVCLARVLNVPVYVIICNFNPIML